MKWHCRAAAAAVFGLVAGCQGDFPILAQGSDASPSVQRSQKPEGPSVQRASFSGLLNQAPEPLAERLDGQTVAAIRATVNGVPILEQEVLSASAGAMEEIRGIPEPEHSHRAREIKNRVLDVLIERELILQDANTRFAKGPGVKFLEKLRESADREFEKQVIRPAKERYHIKTDDEFKKMLQAQGATLDGIRKQFQRQFMYQQYLLFLVQPKLDRIDRERIQEYYDKHPEEFQIQDNVQWQDIFIATSNFRSRDEAQRFAEQVRARARATEDFAQLARQYDNGTSSSLGGEGIGHRRGEIRPREVESFLFQLRDGEVGPLVELTNGFHIVRVVKREYAGTMDFNETTQGQIREKLKNDVFNKESKKVVAELKRKATIERANDTP